MERLPRYKNGFFLSGGLCVRFLLANAWCCCVMVLCLAMGQASMNLATAQSYPATGAQSRQASTPRPWPLISDPAMAPSQYYAPVMQPIVNERVMRGPAEPTAPAAAPRPAPVPQAPSQPVVQAVERAKPIIVSADTGQITTPDSEPGQPLVVRVAQDPATTGPAGAAPPAATDNGAARPGIRFSAPVERPATSFEVPNFSPSSGTGIQVAQGQGAPERTSRAEAGPRVISSDPGAERAAGQMLDATSPAEVQGVTAYQPEEWPRDVEASLQTPSEASLAKVKALVQDVRDPEVFLELDPRHAKLITTRVPVKRYAITHPDILAIVQYSPMEFDLIGLREGQTTVTFWFGDSVLRYLVRVGRDTRQESLEKVEYGVLQDKINELFPESMVQLIPFADKLIVRGQAKDAREASRILSVISNQGVDQAGNQLGPGSFRNLGQAARIDLGPDDLVSSQVINLLEVPQEQQIMLKVRVAEISRSALREMGSHLTINDGNFALESPFGINEPPGLGGNVFQAILDAKEVYYAFQAISTNSYAKLLAEPNLVALNGKPAHFLAGGEFPVPTFVGIGNQTGLSTTFRGFGTQLTFTPTIIGKDLIRLEVSPSFSQRNTDYSVGGIPGLDSRAVTTTADLREGQWLVIAGLLQDQQKGSKDRTPLLGDIPILDIVFSRKEIERAETELVVLISPQVVRPLECEQAPMILPGMEVTEPNDWDFFLWGYYEGRPGVEHRSTRWPPQQQRILEARAEAVRNAKRQNAFQRSETYYTYGNIGFSE